MISEKDHVAKLQIKETEEMAAWVCALKCKIEDEMMRKIPLNDFKLSLNILLTISVTIIHEKYIVPNDRQMV